MYAFLILSSLGLAFYLVLLVALYRDGRRRSVSSGTVRNAKLGTVSGFGTRPSEGGRTIAARKRNAPEDVFWIQVTKHHWKPVSRNTSSNRAELVWLAEPANTKDDLQCG
jgi:hypothetical protein